MVAPLRPKYLPYIYLKALATTKDVVLDSSDGSVGSLPPHRGPSVRSMRSLRSCFRARYFRTIKVSSITASIPLSRTRTDFEIPFEQPK